MSMTTTRYVVRNLYLTGCAHVRNKKGEFGPSEFERRHESSV